jgi:D-3-phosphoglycerate dehydrogenase / 2-oxoglutarate reductase
MFKVLAIGDLFIPLKHMIRVFNGIKEKVKEIKTIKYGSCDRVEFRNQIRKVEHYGPSAENTPENLEEIISNVEIVALHQCPMPKKILASAKRLKIIISARGGLENIDMETANKKNILIINTPNHNANAVAEYTMGLFLAETRNIARSHYSIMNGIWREFYPNTENIPELNSMTIGLLGFGTVGKLVAEKLNCFKSKILVFDPYVSDDLIERYKCYPTEFNTLFKEADIVSVHVRLNNLTKNLIGEKEFRMMKSTSYFVNVARAEIVNTTALYKALKEKWITGAAIDVYVDEPLPPNNPLLTLDNVTLTNHRGGDTIDSYIKAPDIMSSELVKLFSGQKPQFVANQKVFKNFVF